MKPDLLKWKIQLDASIWAMDCIILVHISKWDTVGWHMDFNHFEIEMKSILKICLISWSFAKNNQTWPEICINSNHSSFLLY
jgi:hypothetical protein